MPKQSICRSQIFEEKSLKIVSNGNLSLLTAFVEEVKTVLVAGIVEVFDFELRNGTDPGCGVDENRDNALVAESDNVGSVERLQKLSSLLDGYLGCLTFDDRVSFGSYR